MQIWRLMYFQENLINLHTRPQNTPPRTHNNKHAAVHTQMGFFGSIKKIAKKTTKVVKSTGKGVYTGVKDNATSSVKRIKTSGKQIGKGNMMGVLGMATAVGALTPVGFTTAATTGATAGAIDSATGTKWGSKIKNIQMDSMRSIEHIPGAIKEDIGMIKRLPSDIKHGRWKNLAMTAVTVPMDVTPVGFMGHVIGNNIGQSVVKNFPKEIGSVAKAVKSIVPGGKKKKSGEDGAPGVPGGAGDGAGAPGDGDDTDFDGSGGESETTNLRIAIGVVAAVGVIGAVVMVKGSRPQQPQYY